MVAVDSGGMFKPRVDRSNGLDMDELPLGCVIPTFSDDEGCVFHGLRWEEK